MKLELITNYKDIFKTHKPKSKYEIVVGIGDVSGRFIAIVYVATLTKKEKRKTINQVATDDIEVFNKFLTPYLEPK